MAQETSLISIVPSASQEGTTIKVNEKTGNVTYSAEEPLSQKLIAQIGFNNKTGTLNFVRTNGQVVPVNGFLTSSQFGKGLRGTKGKRGKNANAGREGRVGKIGKTGCEGPIGMKGIIGTKGFDGNDGLTGIYGYMGAPGPPGDNGSEGKSGIDGNQGPMGIPGAGCLIGPSGLQGPQPKEVFYYGSDTPAEDYYLWAFPYIPGQDGLPTSEYVHMTGSVYSESAILTRVTDDAYSGSLVMSLKHLEGGTGPFTYKWEGVDNVFDDVSLAIGNTGSNGTSLEITVLKTITKGTSVSIIGKAALQIRDSTGAIVDINPATFSFTGVNNQVDTGSTTEPGGGTIVVGGGSGGGCIVINTPIHLLDGQELAAGDIMVGDYLTGYTMPGMIDETQEGWKDWTTQSSEGQTQPVTVRNAMRSWYTEFWRINNDIGITIGHEVFVKKGNTWGWHEVDKIELGDNLLNIEGNEIPVVKLDHIIEDVPVIIIDVEDTDTYFVGASKILVHNLSNVQKL